MNFRYLFGPIPSRRLGISLGVDLMPHKTCTLDCIYCECGKTTHLTLKREEYTPVNNIKAELELFLSKEPALDFITFSGSGEPTLHSGIGEIINFIKSKYSRYSIALLTNGTLFDQALVRDDVTQVDILKVSLDSTDEKIFSIINKPHPGLDLKKIINGLIELKKNFKGKLWIEIFIVPDENDNKEEILKIKEILNIINPDKIQLNTLDRPGTDASLKPVESKKMTQIASYFNNAEIISHFHKDRKFSALTEKHYENILTTLRRRPCTIDDISEVLEMDKKKIKICIETLLKENKIEKAKMPRGFFYKVK